MKYGFVIDNRKCIGCHACTTACKSEHQVPVGVNRTWVKQVEKGTFPNTRRLFSVMRCNHCTDAPCVDICPTEALYTREDGIVDFDKDRCIGCKSCMQACPYDALYIDPETHTAAKCNYCAHRVDVGLEPACVNVCPEHAIISGDMDNPNSEISELLARQQVKVRKPEKATQPNLFYIDADDVSLIPTHTKRSDAYFWNSQSLGVGHFAKEAEKMAFSNGDVIQTLTDIEKREARVPKAVEVVLDQNKRIYDAPDKGILWGWEVSAYVWTKAISAGSFLMLFISWLSGYDIMQNSLTYIMSGISILFLILTGILLIKDLDQPGRFLYVLLRPQWGSWLVKGGYAITAFGALLTTLLLAVYMDWTSIITPIMWNTAILALIVAVYTAFLFAQAKGRDFWQSPTLSIHMILHSVMAGAAILFLVNAYVDQPSIYALSTRVLMICVLVNLATIAIEMITTHPTSDAKYTVDMILMGRYKQMFWFGIILMGNVVPLVLLTFLSTHALAISIAALLVIVGIYITEHVWVEAPQRIPLS